MSATLEEGSSNNIATTILNAAQPAPESKETGIKDSPSLWLHGINDVPVRLPKTLDPPGESLIGTKAIVADTQTSPEVLDQL